MEDKAKLPLGFSKIPQRWQDYGELLAVRVSSKWKWLVQKVSTTFELQMLIGRAVQVKWAPRMDGSPERGEFGSCDTRMAAQLETGVLMNSLRLGNTSVLHTDENVKQLPHPKKNFTVCGHNMVEGRWGWNCLEVEIYGGGEIGVKGEDAGQVWWVGKNPKEKEEIQKVKVPTWRNKNHRWRHLLWPHGNAPLRTSHKTHIRLRASDLFRKRDFKQHLPSDQILTALCTVLFFCSFFFTIYYYASKHHKWCCDALLATFIDNISISGRRDKCH